MSRRSLRVIVPGLVATFFLAVTLVAYLTSRHLVLQDMEKSLLQEMRVRLNATQGTVERFLRLRDTEGVKKVISAFGSDLDLHVLLTTDRDGAVLSSTNYHEEGHSLTALDYGADPTIIERVTRDKISEVAISPDRHWLTGYVSVCDPHASVGLRARHCCLLFHQIDLQHHYAQSLESLYGQARIIGVGFALSALLMMLIVLMLFNSIRKTLVIWLTVPLSIIGVTAGLLAFGQPRGLHRVRSVYPIPDRHPHSGAARFSV